MQFVINNWHLFLGIAIVLFLLMAAPISQLIHGVKGVAAAQAVQLLNRESGLFVDVREPTEFAAGHIPDAFHIPLAQLKARVQELEKFKGRPLIVYCRTGQRSGRGAVILRRRGFAAVHNLAGGIQAWQGENLPVRKD